MNRNLIVELLADLEAEYLNSSDRRKMIALLNAMSALLVLLGDEKTTAEYTYLVDE